MTIAEVSSQYGLSPDTLRYYERIGLIPPVRRTAGGIRDYSENDCMWVSFAKCMRGAGLQVEALIEYVSLFQKGDATIEARKADSDRAAGPAARPESKRCSLRWSAWTAKFSIMKT